MPSPNIIPKLTLDTINIKICFYERRFSLEVIEMFNKGMLCSEVSRRLTEREGERLEEDDEWEDEEWEEDEEEWEEEEW